MLPIECIVRGYITGSGWKSYKKDGSVCVIQLPEGLISFEKTIDLVGEDLAKQLRDKSIEIYKKCSEYAVKNGIIIADTKLEFGVDENGTLVLADEVYTPDSSRFWSVDKYEVSKAQNSLDKQYLRDYVSSIGWNKEPPAPELPEEVISILSERYIEIYERITGTEF